MSQSHAMLPPDLGVVRAWIDAEGVHASLRGPLTVDFHNREPGVPAHGWTPERLMVDAAEKVIAGIRRSEWARVSGSPQEAVWVQVVKLGRGLVQS